MRKCAAAIVVGLVTLACGGADDEPEERPPDSCQPSDRMGTYFVTFTTISGDCGPQTSSLVSLDPASVEAESQGCATLSGSITENGCRVDRHWICPYEELEAGASVEFVGVTRQQTEDGAVITGKMTIKLRDSFDQLVCLGTYDVHYERQ